ncbi:MAG: ComEC/Rec2 family competence protein [Pseudomonadota bacterium]
MANRQLAGVLAALVVGDQNAIERADWDVFRATGVAHLMSISGLHITMFAWIASLVLGWLWRRSVRFTPRLCLWLPASSAGALGGLLLAAAYALFPVGACPRSEPSGCWRLWCCSGKAASSGPGLLCGCWPWRSWWRWTRGR